MIEAEEYGITQANIDSLKSTEDPAIKKKHLGVITTLKRERAKEKRVVRKGLRCRSNLCIAKRKQTRGR